MSTRNHCRVLFFNELQIQAEKALILNSIIKRRIVYSCPEGPGYNHNNCLKKNSIMKRCLTKNYITSFGNVI